MRVVLTESSVARIQSQEKSSCLEFYGLRVLHVCLCIASSYACFSSALSPFTYSSLQRIGRGWTHRCRNRSISLVVGEHLLPCRPPLFSDPSPKWLTSCSATTLRQMHVRRMYVCRELTRTQQNKHSAQMVYM
ncbi:hypothetical protein J3F84DRAFT_356800 [Trichoderma pleuroticola]